MVRADGCHRSRTGEGNLVGQSVRLAGLLHAADNVGSSSRLWNQPIRRETMEGAVALARALIPHALVFFDALELDEGTALARYVAKRLTGAAEQSPLTVRTVQRLCDGKKEFQSVEDVHRVLEHLQAHDLVRIEPRASSGGRRPSPWVRLHPALQNGRSLNERTDRTDTSPRTPADPAPSVNSVSTDDTSASPSRTRPASGNQG